MTPQNTTKKDVVDFQEKKKSNSLDQKGLHIGEHGKGAYLHHDKVSRNSTKQSVRLEASSFKTLKMLHQTAVNKEQPFNVPFRFYQNTVIF